MKLGTKQNRYGLFSDSTDPYQELRVQIYLWLKTLPQLASPECADNQTPLIRGLSRDFYIFMQHEAIGGLFHPDRERLSSQEELRTFIKKCINFRCTHDLSDWEDKIFHELTHKLRPLTRVKVVSKSRQDVYVPPNNIAACMSKQP